MDCVVVAARGTPSATASTAHWEGLATGESFLEVANSSGVFPGIQQLTEVHHILKVEMDGHVYGPGLGFGAQPPRIT